MNQKLGQGNIFLIGFMGTGKTAIAQTLNSILKMKVVEMDELIARRADRSISEIFKLYGEEHFRSLESSLLEELQGECNAVISCGGGTPLRAENVAAMKKNGVVVLLTASPDAIYERVKDSHDRPLIENNKNPAFIAELLEERRPKYEAAADIVIDTDGKSPLEICEEMMGRLKEVSDVQRNKEK